MYSLKQKTESEEACPNVFGWGDHGETEIPHVERDHPSYNQEWQL